jgi:DNA polymerase I-like protein with 3'-5' exonuclease and polymerase domains
MLIDVSNSVKRKSARFRAPPRIPDTGFRAPEGPIPGLETADILAIDCETHDPRIDQFGPGWARNDGYIAGVSIATRDAGWYFPLRHVFDPAENIPRPDEFWRWLRWLLNENSVPVVGANLLYDLGWLSTHGVEPRGPLHDVQYAEALIDTYAEVALEVLGRKYCHRGKDTPALYEWIREAYPGTPEARLRADIYRSPVALVGPYAIEDARLPIEVMDAQAPILARDGLEYVYRLECDLIPMLVAMRRRGVKVDLEFAAQAKVELEREIAARYAGLKADYGQPLPDTDSRRVGAYLSALGVEVPRTKEGNYSVTKDWLKNSDHPAAKTINEIREYEKLIGTFINGHIFGAQVNGRVYPQLHQLRSDESGTMVGRFSSSTPNLQQIPARTKHGKLIRKCFVKDDDAVCWTKFDYSQVHYRILAHYAVGPGSDELRARYCGDKRTDYHLDVYMKVAPLMGWSTTDPEQIEQNRRPVKNVNFGLLYGQSVRRLQSSLGFSEDIARKFFDAYFQGAPYVRPTMQAIEDEMRAKGYIDTILGRRIYFKDWEPVPNHDKERPLPFHAARAKWGDSIQLAYGYRAINYRFQGSEPDIMKSGMRALWQSGVLQYTGIPHITVHDELDFSRPSDDPIVREAFDYAQRVLEGVIKLRVPLLVDRSEGPNWGEAK